MVLVFFILYNLAHSFERLGPTVIHLIGMGGFVVVDFFLFFGIQ